MNTQLNKKERRQGVKAIDYWARQLAYVNGHMDVHPAMIHAYAEGFRQAKILARDLLIELGGQQNAGLAILINGIGTAEINPDTGERVSE